MKISVTEYILCREDYELRLRKVLPNTAAIEPSSSKKKIFKSYSYIQKLDLLSSGWEIAVTRGVMCSNGIKP